MHSTLLLSWLDPWQRSSFQQCALPCWEGRGSVQPPNCQGIDTVHRSGLQGTDCRHQLQRVVVLLGTSTVQCSKPISCPSSTTSLGGKGKPLCSAHESIWSIMGQFGDSSHQKQEGHFKGMSGMSAWVSNTEWEYQELPFSTPACFTFLLWEETPQHGHCA